ncbi:hypothetical protein QJS10_CPA06g01054 [Acorus calamus]|uniref:Uncharacterized protein n=1 Tax=Acorus calamus TaxID=4465 RepID=A0AAV9ELZ4_ACOCL|nr:hypothetical protein QJS10_CPA06g01054 [Acorus calamus]
MPMPINVDSPSTSAPNKKRKREQREQTAASKDLDKKGKPVTTSAKLARTRAQKLGTGETKSAIGTPKRPKANKFEEPPTPEEHAAEEAVKAHAAEEPPAPEEHATEEASRPQDVILEEAYVTAVIESVCEDILNLPIHEAKGKEGSVEENLVEDESVTQ